MTYPKKFVMIQQSTNTVSSVQIAWTEETSFFPADGYIMVEVPYDSPVDLNWRYVLNEDTNKMEFLPPLASSGGTTTTQGTGTGGGQTRPPTE